MASPADPLDPRLDAILRAAVDGIVVIDADGLIELFSSSAERMFGWKAEEVVGTSVNRLMPEPFRGEHDGYLKSYLRTGHAKIIGIGREVRAVRKDGTVFPIDLSVGEIVADDKRRFIGLIRDITERKATEELLRVREEELRLTFEHAPVGLALLELTGKFAQVNPALGDILQRPREEVSRMWIEQVLVPPDGEACQRMLLDLRNGKETRNAKRVRFHRRDGSEGIAELACGIVRSADGTPKMIVLQLDDVTQQLRNEETAKRNRLRLAHVTRLSAMGEMAAGIAHEINQPLAAIQAFARGRSRQIDAGQTDEKESQQVLDKISSQALRAGGVIQRVRSFVKKGESRQAPTDLAELIHAVIEIAEIDKPSSDLTVSVDVPPDLPAVAVDGVQVQQVLLNLVRNGLEAMADGAVASSLVEVRARESDGMVEVSVTDRGLGIPSDAEGELFHPFFTTKEDGLGLGLSISQSIVHSHGGRLWFTRPGGGGTTFHFTVPVAGKGDPAADGPVSAEEPR